LYDATLLIAHGTQDTDTVVYYNIYGAAGNKYNDPGARGYLATSAPTVDSSAYGTGTGAATLNYSMKTKDEVFACDVEWYFPQDPDSANFVLGKYTIENISGGSVSDIIVGQLTDFDVTPGTLFTSYQTSTRNHGHYIPEDNLIYQYGWTTPGTPTAPPLGLAERYSAGFMYLAGRDYLGTGLPFQNSQVALRGGTVDLDDLFYPYFDEGGSDYLYGLISGPAGVTVWEGFPDADSSSDLFSYMVLDRGLTLGPGATQSYVLAFVSDTLTHPDLAKKRAASDGLAGVVERAKAWAINHNIISGGGCACPHQSDFDDDGFLTALDLGTLIDILFAGGSDVQDPDCPSARADLDCDAFATALDLGVLIDHLYAGGDAPCDPCAK
jgi:hypothetical protein